MSEHSTKNIVEYSRILSQILNDVLERNYLSKIATVSLSKSQFTILKILSIAGSYTVSEIADILLTSRAAASKNVEKLVRSKLVKRKTIKSDRREVHLLLSESGESIVNSYEQLHYKKQNEALKSFTDAEQAMFSDLLQKFVTQCLSQEKDIDYICIQCNGSIKNGCALINNKERCRFYYTLNKNNPNQKKK